ncbi:peptide/nickel transport system ATP-binding protein [Brevibacterium siliguriense]|uniref:Peptide/nickel transport system ATP-binding protein n=1 Tax=Brevibacterium siliguriense TaxID=1136497 RepID=A0A1H1Y355_9MICO|nr:oligopeptide/dipeptide ABC transporter ATP-binding protein [Brevibacterium siliguriense]SDT15958.1 peptide/nickel transport system ATP-binding protein [Brevibacterium siliguriense]
MSTSLEVDEVVKTFPVRSGLFRRRTGTVHAVSGVSLDVPAGTSLGIVGESGSGKSTLGRSIVRLHGIDSGSIRLGGNPIEDVRGDELRTVRRKVQMVFQDPFASLNPRLTIGSALTEAMEIHGLAAGRRPARVSELLDMVGLRPEYAQRYPHQFSGGQRQRIGIARALAVEPEVIVLDEPVSALDVSVQAGVLNRLADIQRELGLTYVFIAHDLSVVRYLCDQVVVMYLGTIVESGPTEQLFESPAHPYTKALLSAVPIPDPRLERGRERITLSGDIPSPLDPPSGCPFRTRCWKATEVCAVEVPIGQLRNNGTTAACHHPEV